MQSHQSCEEMEKKISLSHRLLKISVLRENSFYIPFDRTNDDVAIVHAHSICAKPLDFCLLTQHLVNPTPDDRDFGGMNRFESSLP